MLHLNAKSVIMKCNTATYWKVSCVCALAARLLTMHSLFPLATVSVINLHLRAVVCSPYYICEGQLEFESQDIPPGLSVLGLVLSLDFLVGDMFMWISLALVLNVMDKRTH